MINIKTRWKVNFLYRIRCGVIQVMYPISLTTIGGAVMLDCSISSADATDKA